MKFVVSFFLFFLVLCFCFSPQVRNVGAKVKEEQIKGYITQVHSPTSFEIEDYKMSLDGKYDVELQNIEDKALKFDPKVHIKVGTLVKIKCKVNTETLEAKVVEMQIDAKQFRKLS